MKFCFIFRSALELKTKFRVTYILVFVKDLAAFVSLFCLIIYLIYLKIFTGFPFGFEILKINFIVLAIYSNLSKMFFV
jgi:hypothetical protein